MIFSVNAAFNFDATTVPSTNCLATNRPIPVPTVLRVVKKASKTFGRVPAGISDAVVFNRQNDFIADCRSNFIGDCQSDSMGNGAGIFHRHGKNASPLHGINRIREQVRNHLHHFSATHCDFF